MMSFSFLVFLVITSKEVYPPKFCMQFLSDLSYPNFKWADVIVGSWLFWVSPSKWCNSIFKKALFTFFKFYIHSLCLQLSSHLTGHLSLPVLQGWGQYFNSGITAYHSGRGMLNLLVLQGWWPYFSLKVTVYPLQIYFIPGTTGLVAVF